MRKSVFRVIPDVSEKSKLVTSGPYAFVRHPMYTSIIIISAVLLLNSFSVMRLLYFIFLFIVLILKIKYEEEQLASHFNEYKLYMGDKARIIPFIY